MKKILIERNDMLYEFLKKISESEIQNPIEKYKHRDVLRTNLIKLTVSLQNSNLLKNTTAKMITYCENLNRNFV